MFSIFCKNIYANNFYHDKRICWPPKILGLRVGEHNDFVPRSHTVSVGTTAGALEDDEMKQNRERDRQRMMPGLETEEKREHPACVHFPRTPPNFSNFSSHRNHIEILNIANDPCMEY